MGKRPGDAAMSQEEINAQLVELGRAGMQVVRLKGGDPFVFGRGGEEAEALVEAGVRFEVVPGVTSGVAAPAYAGIPVTHRDLASAVAFVTGHEDPAKSESALDWDALARFPGTLVLYMGVRSLPRVAERLVAGGRDPAEPAAVVERGTLPGQRTRGGDAARHRRARGGGGHPGTRDHVVGPAAGLRDTLAWVERRPLHGRWWPSPGRARRRAAWRAAGRRSAPRWSRRPRSGSSRAGRREVPRRCRAIREYALVCFTSPNGVGLLLDGARRARADARAFAGATVAAIGPGTAAELRGTGSAPTWCPTRSIAEALVEALEEVPVEGRRVLVARAAEARDVLPDALRERGAERGRRGALRHRGRAARPTSSWTRSGGRLRDLHLELHRALLHARPAGPCRTRPASCRSGRSRARPRASTA